MLQAQNKMLSDQLDDLENRSRRNNLRILNIPEGSEHGKDPLKFISELLTEAFGLEVFTMPPELERVHWTPTLRSSQRTSPHTFLVCFTSSRRRRLHCVGPGIMKSSTNVPLWGFTRTSPQHSIKRELRSTAWSKLCMKRMPGSTYCTRHGYAWHKETRCLPLTRWRRHKSFLTSGSTRSRFIYLFLFFPDWWPRGTS